MIIVFWMITFLFLISAFGFILPWIRSWRIQVLIGFGIALFSYGLYFNWGSSRYLTAYYSDEEQVERIKRIEFRKLLTAFKKQEFRLRLRLEENPNDLEAEWRLLDILAIKALQNQDRKLASEYWKRALEKIPKGSNTEIRNRITGLLKNNAQLNE